MKKCVKYSIVSFSTSFVLLFLIFLSLKTLFSDFTLFVGDSLVQYLPFINSFVDDVINGDSIWYSFSNYLGSGNILTVVYYCLSPFNVLFYICGDNFYLAYVLIIMFKISLSASTFCYFICKFLNKERLYYIAASLFYSLSGYVIVMFFNIMWLDAIYIMPVLIWLIVRYIKDKKYIALIMCYFYLFLTNFYMAYMVGVFSAIFFLMYYWYSKEYKFKGNIKKFIFSGLGFAGCVVLAAGIGAFLLLSTAGFMTEHTASDNFDFEPLVASIPDFINSMFIGEFMTMNNKTPLLYCGLPTIALFFFFFACKKIDIKTKVFYGVQIAFFSLCMGLMPLYKFMHAFDYPNFYGFRFSFIIIFLIIIMSCIALDEVTNESFSFFLKCAVVMIVFYSVMMTFQLINFSNVRINDQNGLAINSLFTMLWLLIAYLFGKYNNEVNDNGEACRNIVIFRRCLCTFVSVVIAFELFVNGYLCIKHNDFGLIEKNAIKEWYFSEKQAVSSLKEIDDSFYRVYVNNEICINSSKMFDYNSITTFSSSDNYELRMALSRLGLSTSNRFLRTNCSVPVFDSLFAVNYAIRIPDFSEFSEMEVDSKNYVKSEIVKNEFPLSLGYMVSKDILEYQFTSNSFENLENLCNAMTGENRDVFEEIKISDEDNLFMENYTMHREGEKYVFTGVSQFAGEPLVAVALDGENSNAYVEFFYDSPMSYMYFPTVYTQEMGTSEAKYVSEGGINKMTINEGMTLANISCEGLPLEFFIDRINVANYNKEEYRAVYEMLSKNQFEVIENDEDYIVGKVVATEEKPLLFLSVPYEPEWHIFVDGKPLEKLYCVLGDAFMAIELSPGEHVVTMQYIEKWSTEGAIISLVSMIIFCGIVLFNVANKGKKKIEEINVTEEKTKTDNAETKLIDDVNVSKAESEEEK